MKFRYMDPEFWKEAAWFEYVVFGLLLVIFLTVLIMYLLLNVLAGPRLHIGDLVIIPSFYFCISSADAMIKGVTSKDW
jgi:hypothetical protein